MRCVSYAVLVAFIGCSTTLASLGSLNDSWVARPQSASTSGKAYTHYLTAMVHQRNGRMDEAVDQLNKALNFSPHSVTLLTALVDAHLMQQQYDKAVSVIEKAVKEKPDDPRLHILQGRIYQALDWTDKAIAAFQKVIELAPDSPDGLTYLTTMAALEENTNDLVAAIEVYEELVRLHPESPILQFQLGLTLARINDSDRARAALEKTIELDPSFNRARYLLGLVYFEQDDNEKAVEHLRAFVEHEPEDAAALQTLAASLGRLERYPEAVQLLQQLVASESTQPTHNIALMYVLLRANQPGQAADAAPKDSAQIVSTILRAIARRHAGEPYAEIIETLDQVDSDLDAEGTRFVNELLHLFGKNRAGSFLEQEMRTFREDGLRSKAMETLLARVYLTTEQPEKAVEALADVLTTYGPDKWTHYYLALAYEELDNFEEIEKHLTASLELEPNDPDLLNYLGYTYADKNVHLDKAQEMIQKALMIDPENGYYLDSLGWVYYRKKNAEQAIFLIRKAILAMTTDDPVLRDHLGDAYLLRGDVKKALGEWRRAMRLDPNLEGVREKIEAHKIQETKKH